MYAVIDVPDFALQAVMRSLPEAPSPAQPVILLDERGAVSQMTPAARRAGVRQGMTSTQAMARCSEICVFHRSEAREREAHESLLHGAYAFSPWIEATASDVCTMQLKGLPAFALHDRETSAETDHTAARRQFGLDMVGALARLNLRVRVGVAENPLMAWHAARVAKPFLLVDDPAAFMAPLPLEILNGSLDTLVLLKKWGIHTVGALTALDKEEVVARLGPEILTLHERANPSFRRPLHWVKPPEHFRESVDFERDIDSMEPLLVGVRRFLDQICRRLRMTGRVAAELHLRLHFGDALAPHEKRFRIPAPTRDVGVLERMMQTHLETLRTDHPVRGLAIEAVPCPEQSDQLGLFEASLRDPNRFYDTLARLTALVGAERVGSPEIEDTHRPDAFRLHPFEQRDRGRDRRRQASRFKMEVERTNEGVSLCEGLRLRRYRPAIPASVQLQNNRPRTLQTDQIQDRICKTLGPWRRSGDWWDGEDRRWIRDEWDVETVTGTLYRLCQVEEAWYVEGVYD